MPKPDVKTLKIGKQFRAISAEKAQIDMEKRTVTFSFSSETPVERWYGAEILSHQPGACDLTRFNGGANALFNHDMDDYVGVIEKAWIGEDRRGYCEVRFSKNEFADQILKDIADGILRNVSFGYQINDIVLSRKDDEGNCEYTATLWTPYEVTFCTVPADPTVGVGRSEPSDGIEIKIKFAGYDPAPKGERTMPPENQPQPVDVKTVQADAARSERERISSIQALGEKFNLSELSRKLISDGASLDSARAAFLEVITKTQRPVGERDADIGLTNKEIKQFSFVKAIRAMSEPHNKAFQEDAAFEREVSVATQKLTGREARGFLVPFDILRMPMSLDGKSRRDLVVGTGSAGGDLVATNLLASSFIELLRNKSIVQAAGATVLSGLVGNIAIPRKTTAATVYWVGEGGAPTEGNLAFDQVGMSPKTVGGFIDYSRKLMLQSSLDVESLVRGDLAEGLALEIDRVGLYGSGSSNQPLGLKDTSGVNTKDFAAAAPTWPEIVYLETAVNAANADIGAMKYITNAVGSGNLKTTAKASNTAIFLMEDGECNGYPVLRSNQVASGDHWFGVWSQLMIGFWSGLDILVDPYTGGTAGTMRVIAHQDCDIAARQPTAFTRGNDSL